MTKHAHTNPAPCNVKYSAVLGLNTKHKVTNHWTTCHLFKGFVAAGGLQPGDYDLNSLVPIHHPEFTKTKHKKNTISHYCKGVLTLSWLNLVTLIFRRQFPKLFVSPVVNK